MGVGLRRSEGQLLFKPRQIVLYAAGHLASHAVRAFKRAEEGSRSSGSGTRGRDQRGSRSSKVFDSRRYSLDSSLATAHASFLPPPKSRGLRDMACAVTATCHPHRHVKATGLTFKTSLRRSRRRGIGRGRCRPRAACSQP